MHAAVHARLLPDRSERVADMKGSEISKQLCFLAELRTYVIHTIGL